MLGVTLAPSSINSIPARVIWTSEPVKGYFSLPPPITIVCSVISSTSPLLLLREPDKFPCVASLLHRCDHKTLRGRQTAIAASSHWDYHREACTQKPQISHIQLNARFPPREGVPRYRSGYRVTFSSPEEWTARLRLNITYFDLVLLCIGWMNSAHPHAKFLGRNVHPL